MPRLPRIVSLGLASAFLAFVLIASPAFAQDDGDPLDDDAIVVVAFGDSITWGLGDTGVVCRVDATPEMPAQSGGYPPRLEERVANRGTTISIVNEGVCGERTSQGLTRIERVLDENPDAEAVIVMEGTNDLSSRDISTESMRFNVYQMAEKVLDELAWPVIAGPIPRSPDAPGENDRAAFLTKLLRQDTVELGIDFAETFDELIGVPNLYDRYYDDPFHPNAAGYDLLVPAFVAPVLSALDRPPVGVGPCPSDERTLCLADERFRVRMKWRDGEGVEGDAMAFPLTDDTGFFWFFDEENLELGVKVLDGRAINGAFWVYFGALSDLEYTLTVIDTTNGDVKVYRNPAGSLVGGTDTQAFPQP